MTEVLPVLPPTRRQIDCLRRNGISMHHITTREVASDVIAELERNGWKRPSEERLAEIIVGECLDDDFGDVDDH